jgi:hypothetical protein
MVENKKVSGQSDLPWVERRFQEVSIFNSNSKH